MIAGNHAIRQISLREVILPVFNAWISHVHGNSLRLCDMSILNIIVFNGLFSVCLVNPVQLLCSQKPGQQ